MPLKRMNILLKITFIFALLINLIGNAKILPQLLLVNAIIIYIWLALMQCIQNN